MTLSERLTELGYRDASSVPELLACVRYRDIPVGASFMAKGMETLEAGDTLEFLFDFYDDEGNLVSTKTYGKKVRVTSDRRIAVKDESLGECDIQFGGLLTDIYQRTFLTEMLEAHVE